jgi:hypothetical protein
VGTRRRETYLIVRDAVTVCESAGLELVPVTARVVFPFSVEGAVTILSVELPVPVTGLGSKVAVAPLGSPAVTEKLTMPVNPLSAETLTV